MQAQKLFPKKLIFCHFYIYAKFKQALKRYYNFYLLNSPVRVQLIHFFKI